MNLTRALKARAAAAGFDLVGIAPVGPSPDHDRYVQWLEAGYAGEMGYLTRHCDLKADPRSLLPEAQSLIMVGLNYASAPVPGLRTDPSRGQIAAYALGDDYHELMRKALIELDGWLRTETDRHTRGRVFVDSAPILERSWSKQAGLGFSGKNTCLIHPQFGSWFFLGGLLVPERLHYDAPPEEIQGRAPALIEEKSLISDIDYTLSGSQFPSWRFGNGRLGTCGRCTRCLDICPTAALVTPYQLDAKLCISYLTIEIRGEIPFELRANMGNWVFGCDLCQDVCPWNHQTPLSTHPSLQPKPDRLAPPLIELLSLDRDAFSRRFRKSAVKRARWEGFMRNVCIAAGNWADPLAADALYYHLLESPTLVATHASWALGRLSGGAGLSALRQAHARATDPVVIQSIEKELARSS